MSVCQKFIPNLFRRCIVVQNVNTLCTIFFSIPEFPPVATDDIRSIYFCRCNHLFNHRRKYPVIGIHKGNLCPGRLFQTMFPCTARARIFNVDHPDLWKPCGKFITNLRTMICRLIIHQDDFHVFVSLIQQRPYTFMQISFYVIHRNDNRNFNFQERPS